MVNKLLRGFQLKYRVQRDWSQTLRSQPFDIVSCIRLLFAEKMLTMLSAVPYHDTDSQSD